MHKYISLFTGAMGLDIGLEQAGFECSLCSELDVKTRETIALNRPRIPMFFDVSYLTKKHLKEHHGCTLVAGGPPCQSFSTAGSRRGFDDPRGVMLLEFGRVVDIVRPRFFVLENVPGLMTIKPPEGKSAKIMFYLIQSYKKMGYKVIWGRLNAVDFGGPQFRERVFIVGSRDDEDIYLPLPTHFKKHQYKEYRWRTLGDVIEWSKKEPGPCGKFAKSKQKWVPKIPEGGNWKSLTDDEAREALGGAYNSSGGKTGYLRRLSWDEPCPTLLTSPTQKATMLIHPEEDRPLSIMEYARIQEFPKTWEFAGSVTDQYKQIGNAVPVALSHAIGHMLSSIIKGTSEVKCKRPVKGT